MSQLSQEGKTRYTHYSIAYHLVWISKYRRKILVGKDLLWTSAYYVGTAGAVSAEVIRR